MLIFRQHSSATLIHDPATQRRNEKTPPPWPHVVQRPEQYRWGTLGCSGTLWSVLANTRTLLWDTRGHSRRNWSARGGPLKCPGVVPADSKNATLAALDTCASK